MAVCACLPAAPVVAATDFEYWVEPVSAELLATPAAAPDEVLPLEASVRGRIGEPCSAGAIKALPS